MSGEPEQVDLNDLTRDAYAHFGLAYYSPGPYLRDSFRCSPQGVAVTRGATEERTKRLRALTLGSPVKAAKDSIPVFFVKLVRWQAGQRGSQVAMMRATASRAVMKAVVKMSLRA